MEMAKTRTPSASERSSRNSPGRQTAQPLSETPLHQLVGGEKLAAEVMRKE